jgi:hypothetical protein
MLKKIFFLFMILVSVRSFAMFGALPGQVQSTDGSGVASRLASISENSTSAAANSPDTKNKAEKEAIIARPKSLKPRATRVVVRRSNMKPGQVLELYEQHKFLRGIPFKQLHGISLAGILKKSPDDIRALMNQCSSWAVIDEKTEIEDKTKA